MTGTPSSTPRTPEVSKERTPQQGLAAIASHLRLNPQQVDDQMRLEELRTVASLLTTEDAAHSLHTLTTTGRLDPARAALAGDLLSPMTTTLYLPLTEAEAENIRGVLLEFIAIHWYEEQRDLPIDEDDLTALHAAASALASLCQAKTRADMTWQSTRRDGWQPGVPFDATLWKLLGMLAFTPAQARLEQAREEYPDHGTIIDLLLPLATHLDSVYAGYRAAERATPAPTARLIKPETITRLKALQGDFADDEQGIQWLIDMGALVAGMDQESEAAPIPASGAAPQQEPETTTPAPKRERYTPEQMRADREAAVARLRAKMPTPAGVALPDWPLSAESSLVEWCEAHRGDFTGDVRDFELLLEACHHLDEFVYEPHDDYTPSYETAQGDK